MTFGRRILLTSTLLGAGLFIASDRATGQTAPPAAEQHADPGAQPTNSPRVLPSIRAEAERREYVRKVLDQTITGFDEALAKPGARLESRHFAQYAHYVLMLNLDAAKAESALQRLFKLQDIRPDSRTFGEFAIAEGAGIIANSSGETASAVTEYTVFDLVQIALRYDQKLSPEMRELLIERLKHALRAIQRAERSPDTAAVFLMNAVDELLIGELLRDQKATAMATGKLMQFSGLLRSRGMLEYNSSNQTAMQLICLLVARNYSRTPDARRLIDPMTKYLWSSVSANVVPGRGTLGGSQSRTTDFIFGIGTIDTFTFLEGLRDGPPYLTPFSDGLRALVNQMEEGYRPEEEIRKLAFEPERIIRQRWGPQAGQDRYSYITPDYALGSASSSASFYDRKLVAEFTTPRLLPAIWVVPDPFDAPFGQIRDRKTNQLRHPQHFVEQIAAVQEKNALLAIMNLRHDVKGKLTPSVATNVVFPAAVDEVLLDGIRVPMDKAFEMNVTANSTLIVREGTGAVAIRLFHVDGMDGQRPVMQLKFEANQWASARLVGYHFRAPAGMQRPPAEQNIRAGVMMIAEKVAGPEDLQRFVQRVANLKIEQSGEIADEVWRAKLTDGERVLETGLNLNTGAIVARKVNGQDYQPAVFKFNARDLAAEFLGN